MIKVDYERFWKIMTSKKKLFLAMVIPCGCAMIFAIFMCVFFFCVDRNNLKTMNSSGVVNFEGTYQYGESGESYPYTSDTQWDASSEQILILKGHFDRDLLTNQTVFFFIDNIQVQIYCNGEKVYYYSSREEGGFSPGGGSWCVFQSTGIKSTDDVEIILSSIGQRNMKEAYNEFIKQLFVGDGFSLLRHILINSGGSLIFSLMIMIIGLVLLIIAITMLKLKMLKRLATVWLSMFTMTGGVWMFMDFDYISILIPYPKFVSYISVFCKCFMVIWMLLYFVHFIHGKLRTVMVAIEYSMIGYLVIFSTAFLSGTLQYFEMQFPMAILFACAIVISLGCLCYEYIMYKTNSTQSVLESFSIMLLLCGGDIINYFYPFMPMGICTGIGVITFVISQMVRIFGYVNSNILEIQNTKEMDNELLKSQITLMISQIRPHFIFNTLNAIGDVCSTDPEKAEDAIVQFSKYLRSNIMLMEGKEYINISDEMENVTNYVNIEQLRFGSRISFETDLQAPSFEVPILCIQPFVENAIKHGLRPKPEGGVVKVSTRKEKENYVITIEDNGIGFDVKGIEKKRESVGIRNIQKRIEMLMDGKVTIESKFNKGTIVTIEIPKTKRLIYFNDDVL